MGKDLKGKELGPNISQEKTGLYLGRITDSFGKRHSKRFKSYQECRKWVAETSEHRFTKDDITVEDLYKQWLDNKKYTVKRSTYLNLISRYEKYIGPFIGRLRLSDVKPFHCQHIFNTMREKGLRSSSLGEVRHALNNLFTFATDNDLLIQNPLKKSVKSDIGKPQKEKRVLTKSEQSHLLNTIRGSTYELQYRLILQTGLRIGEAMGLKVQDIDFEHNFLYVRRTLSYDPETHSHYESTPKSESGNRKIPLTPEAVAILKEQLKRRSSGAVNLKWKDTVFLSARGLPIRHSDYDVALNRICKKANIPKISVHTLRHTFATRCIEANLNPKQLQTILGHSSLKVTMDLYVHPTDEASQEAIQQIADELNVV